MALFIRVALFMALFYWLFIRPNRRRVTRNQGPQKPPSQTHGSLPPHQVLGVSPQANWTEIKKAYYEALSRYHPDKVEHLGEEIKKVAREKTHEIRKAFEHLKQEKGQ